MRWWCRLATTNSNVLQYCSTTGSFQYRLTTICYIVIPHYECFANAVLLPYALHILLLLSCGIIFCSFICSGLIVVQLPPVCFFIVLICRKSTSYVVLRTTFYIILPLLFVQKCSKRQRLFVSRIEGSDSFLFSAVRGLRDHGSYKLNISVLRICILFVPFSEQEFSPF